MKRICLFDIDGTLTKSRSAIDSSMKQTLLALSKILDIGFVGGSDEQKIRTQLDPQTISYSSYFFPQNGLIAYKKDTLIESNSIGRFLKECQLQRLLNFCLHYIADLSIPVKRGTFIEYRKGLINVSPIGRNCSQQEREEFQIYDSQHQVRARFISKLRAQFKDLPLQYSIGGQISFDIFPIGWDKTYCLKHVSHYQEIYFFGDKTHVGGNDHEIYEEIKKRNTAYSIKNGPQETISILKELFLK